MPDEAGPLQALMQPTETALAFFGPGARLHHVGLAVNAIEALLPEADQYVDRVQGVSASFVDLYGLRIELLEPLDDRSPIARNLKDGVKLLHLCYEVPDIQAAIKAGRPQGFHKLSGPVPTPTFGDRKIAWLFSKTYGLFELLEQEPEP